MYIYMQENYYYAKSGDIRGVGSCFQGWVLSPIQIYVTCRHTFAFMIGRGLETGICTLQNRFLLPQVLQLILVPILVKVVVQYI